jgi:hypothetical protein
MSNQFHDWLLGEDSALRTFLPPTLSACSPQADAPAAAETDCSLSPGGLVGPDRTAAGAPISEETA